MIEIAAIACSLYAPVHCREVVLPFEAAQITPYSCMFNGQTKLAEWTAAHPNWRIARFTCRKARQAA